MKKLLIVLAMAMFMYSTTVVFAAGPGPVRTDPNPIGTGPHGPITTPGPGGPHGPGDGTCQN